jgi:hypothetical protein
VLGGGGVFHRYSTGIPAEVFDEKRYFSRNSYEIPSFEIEFQLGRFLWGIPL